MHRFDVPAAARMRNQNPHERMIPQSRWPNSSRVLWDAQNLEHGRFQFADGRLIWTAPVKTGEVLRERAVD